MISAVKPSPKSLETSAGCCGTVFSNIKDEVEVDNSIVGCNLNKWASTVGLPHVEVN